MVQFATAMKRHPNALLFFRMGDFRELHFRDAKGTRPVDGVPVGGTQIHFLERRWRPAPAPRTCVLAPHPHHSRAAGRVDSCRRSIMGVRGARWILAAAIALLTGGAARGEDPARGAVRGNDVYVRGTRDLAQTVERVLDDEALSAVGTVVFAFEAASFAPPPGRTEFTAFYGFQADVAAWAEALAARGRKDNAFHLLAVTSLETDPIDMSRPASDAALRGALERRWAKEPKGPSFRPAATWMADALRAARRLTKSEQCALVYVADRVLPERAFEYAEDQERERGWRQHLVPAGTYFDEEAVGRKLVDLRTRLFVIAPEAHFEDFTPLAELPALPWASRPEILSWPSGLDPFEPSSTPPTGRTPPSGPPGPPGELPPLTEEEIQQILRGLPPGTPEEIKRAIAESLRQRSRGAPAPPSGPKPAPPPQEEPDPDFEDGDLPPEVTGPDFPSLPGAAPRRGGKGRFHSTTPTWFPRVGRRTPWCNHTPSAYGTWEYARAAAITGGRYLFYPFPPGTWLDVCPTSPPQIADLAPELVKRSEFARVGAGDAAWDALDRIVRSVMDATPWDDEGFGDRRSGSWGAFTGRRPLAPEKRWEPRRKPRDDALGTSGGYASELERRGERLLSESVPAYARAIREADETLAALRSPDAPRTHPRALADLTLARFWLASSRFHLHALGIYSREVERFRPDDPDEPVDHYVITYVPAIQLSDVLDAYDGLTIGPAEEERYARSAPPGVKGMQDNLLGIPRDDPLYRARRDTERVLVNLDPRLQADARDMIEAARAVMARYARTPWGWTTYYSVAYTFVWHPVPPTRGSTGPMGGVGPTPPSEDPDAPTTPGGGSTGGGPTTGPR